MSRFLVLPCMALVVCALCCLVAARSPAAELPSSFPSKPSFISPPISSPSGGGTVSSASPAPGGNTWDLSWIAGTEYTPAMAPGNSLWWWRWEQYAEEVEKELTFASRHFGFNFLRMFLHPMVFDGEGSSSDGGRVLFAAMSEFLNVAEQNGFRVSFGFFDDCWNHAGASLACPCVPVKGRHNGCWMASPQDVQRTSVDRFQPYVYETVRRFANDSRVAFWEIYNEPQQSNTFSIALRSAAFGWAAQALQDSGVAPGTVPILSCWDDNNATQVVDMHRYDTNFVAWTQQVFQNPSKGALITEGGSRWYAGYTSDSGSPLTVLHWYNHLRQATPSKLAPFAFGMVINWELMVGNSNTRWHWNTHDGSPEPVIPWDAFMFPDGTPVSYTEAAVVRNWTRGIARRRGLRAGDAGTGADEHVAVDAAKPSGDDDDDLWAFDKFLPDTALFTGDSFLCLKPDQSYNAQIRPGIDGSRVLAETTVWPSGSAGGGILVRASPSSSFPSSSSSSSSSLSGYFAGWRNTTMTHPMLVLELWNEGAVISNLASFDMSSLDCGLVTDGWNMLRVVAEGPMISVYANPMFPDAVSPLGIQPRISVNAQQGAVYFPTGGVALVAVGDADAPCTQFDYIGVMDPRVL